MCAYLSSTSNLSSKSTTRTPLREGGRALSGISPPNDQISFSDFDGASNPASAASVVDVVSGSGLRRRGGDADEEVRGAAHGNTVSNFLSLAGAGLRGAALLLSASWGGAAGARKASLISAVPSVGLPGCVPALLWGLKSLTDFPRTPLKGLR